MKKYILIITATLALASCDIETSDNGKLDGYWHLERVDTLATGGTADYSGQLAFWGAQYHLIALKDQGATGHQRFYLRFQQTADSLNITRAYEDHWHEDNQQEDVGGDIPVEEVNDGLRFYGINALPEGFAKERLDGSRMVLRSKTLRLTFRKF